MAAGRRSALAFGLSAVCLCVQACGFGFKVDVGLAQWAVDGDFALEPTSAAGAGGDNDIGDALGFEDWRATPYVRLEAEADKTSLSLATLWFNENASGRLQHAFGPLPAGEQVRTEASFTSIRFAAHYDLFERDPITISPGIGLHYLDMDVRASSPLGQGRIDAELPMPSLYVKTKAELGPITGELDLGLGGIILPQDTGTVTDIETIIRWNPAPLLELFAGYRFAFFHIRGESDARDYSSDFVLHGWLVGFKIGP